MSGAATAEGPPRFMQRTLGPGAEARPDGLYEVPTGDGESVVTHGPDMQMSRSGGDGLGRGAPERRAACVAAPHVQLLYASIRRGPSRFAAMAPRLRRQLRRINAVLNRESLASGGGPADFKVACDASGRVRVGRFTTARPTLLGIVRAAKAAGFQNQRVKYMIFLDGGRSLPGCGVGSYLHDERLVASNRNNVGVGYALIYRDCWFGATPLHELAHMLGAVQYEAPFSTGTGTHCYDEMDVMCYSPDGGDRNQTSLNPCSDAVRFDCGFDDYFDSAPEPGEYLATHWNLGSPLNRFLHFGTPPAPGGGESWRHHRFKVRRHTRAVKVKLSATPGAPVTLYVRPRRPATREGFACRAYPSGRSASCRIRTPRRGTWFASVRTEGSAETSRYRLRARTGGRMRKLR
jgi:hypothetical protein